MIIVIITIIIIIIIINVVVIIIINIISSHSRVHQMSWTGVFLSSFSSSLLRTTEISRSKEKNQTAGAQKHIGPRHLMDTRIKMDNNNNNNRIHNK